MKVSNDPNPYVRLLKENVKKFSKRKCSKILKSSISSLVQCNNKEERRKLVSLRKKEIIITPCDTFHMIWNLKFMFRGKDCSCLSFNEKVSTVFASSENRIKLSGICWYIICTK